jgi:hypothetical protein
VKFDDGESCYLLASQKVRDQNGRRNISAFLLQSIVVETTALPPNVYAGFQQVACKTNSFPHSSTQVYPHRYRAVERALGYVDELRKCLLGI